MKTLLAIACGGALGSALRYVCNEIANRYFSEEFPWDILAINVAGSLCMGLAVGIFAQLWQPPQEIRSFLTTGVLGGFTTFSAFSLDSVMLLERGNTAGGVAYIVASVGLSIVALYLGLMTVRVLTT